jgi:hypothetical protein
LAITVLTSNQVFCGLSFEVLQDHLFTPPSRCSQALGKGCFAESRTRQSPALGNEVVYRVQDTRHRKTLGKDNFTEWQTLGKGGSRQRAVSGRSKADGRQPLPRAEGRHSAKNSLPSVFCGHSAKHIFIF